MQHLMLHYVYWTHIVTSGNCGSNKVSIITSSTATSAFCLFIFVCSGFFLYGKVWNSKAKLHYMMHAAIRLKTIQYFTVNSKACSAPSILYQLTSLSPCYQALLHHVHICHLNGSVEHPRPVGRSPWQFLAEPFKLTCPILSAYLLWCPTTPRSGGIGWKGKHNPVNSQSRQMPASKWHPIPSVMGKALCLQGKWKVHTLHQRLTCEWCRRNHDLPPHRLQMTNTNSSTSNSKVSMPGVHSTTLSVSP